MQKNEPTFEHKNPVRIDMAVDHLQTHIEPATALFRVGSSVNRLGKKISSLLQDELNRIGVQDIGPNELMLLFALRDGYLSVGDLGDQLGVKGSNLTYYINGLEKLAYIERRLSQQNRRTIQLTMQPKARQICAVVDLNIEKLINPAVKYPTEGDEMAITHDMLLRLEQLLFSFSGQQS